MIKKRSDITGVILAGGKSSRMGKDKALLYVGGKSFIEQVAKTLKQVFNDVVVVSDHDDRYKFLGLPIYQDVIKRCGPLGGIHSALINAMTEKVFIISCDMPLLRPSAIQTILNDRRRGDVKLFSLNGEIQPLCGVYNRRCLPIIENHLKRKQYSVQKILGDVNSIVIIPKGRSSKTLSQQLFNINTLREYEKYRCNLKT